jgi:CheY-like chemotaxis protein
MSKDFLPHIFEPFSQEESSPTGKYGSTGLGMSITKSIVELMNGTITVDSEKGKGTTFSVTITFGESEKKSIDNDIGMPALHDMSVLTAKTADLIGRRVLLAEDVSINAEIITMILSMREMEVDLAENGQIAVDLFAAHEPGYYAAILMDMRMPVMGGLEATRCIRNTDKEDAKTIPIIALTANAFDEDVQRSIQAGLNAHLSKPVEPDVLYETLEKLIGISSAATAQAAPQE